MSKITKTTRKELKLRAEKKGRDFDFSDIPATYESDWTDAIRGKHFRPVFKSPINESLQKEEQC